MMLLVILALVQNSDSEPIRGTLPPTSAISTIGLFKENRSNVLIYIKIGGTLIKHDFGFAHHTVNHSLYFVDLITGVHKQTINSVKRLLSRQCMISAS